MKRPRIIRWVSINGNLGESKISVYAETHNRKNKFLEEFMSLNPQIEVTEHNQGTKLGIR